MITIEIYSIYYIDKFIRYYFYHLGIVNKWILCVKKKIHNIREQEYLKNYTKGLDLKEKLGLLLKLMINIKKDRQRSRNL